MNEETQKLYDARCVLVADWEAACWALMTEGTGLPDAELKALIATVAEHAQGAEAIKSHYAECRQKELAKRGPRISIQEI